jgi:hypothetical protein
MPSAINDLRAVIERLDRPRRCKITRLPWGIFTSVEPGLGTGAGTARDALSLRHPHWLDPAPLAHLLADPISSIPRTLIRTSAGLAARPKVRAA